MTLTVAPVDAARPELALERWLALAGEDEATLRQNRAMLLANVAAFENPFFVAAAWRGDTLRGLAVAVEEVHPPGRRVLAVTLPGTLHRAHCRGLWVTRGEEVGDVVTELLSGLAGEARTLGYTRLVVAPCPADDPVVPTVAAGLGFRSLQSQEDRQLLLPADAGYEEYLAGLSRHRRANFRQDLRAPARHGAEIRIETPPTLPTLDAIWPFYLDTLQRKQSPLVPRGVNLFRELQQQLGPDDLGVATYHRGGEPLGFVLWGRGAGSVRFPFVGHADAPELSIYSSLFSAAIAAELARGARTVLLGYGTSTYKERVGTEGVAQLTLVLPLAG